MVCVITPFVMYDIKYNGLKSGELLSNDWQAIDLVNGELRFREATFGQLKWGVEGVERAGFWVEQSEGGRDWG